MYGYKKKGHRMSTRRSSHMFSRVAQWIHPFNVHSDSMRGGFRL